MILIIKILFFFLIFLPQCESMQTTKGEDMIFVDGFEWRKKGQSADGSTQFWQCPKNWCKGRAHSAIGSEVLRIITPHDHMRDLPAHTIRQRKEMVKDIARNNPQLPAREINMQARENLGDEELMRMPSGSAVQRQVNLQREDPDARLVNAKNLIEIEIAGDYTLDLEGNLFLLYDSRITQPEEAVFFIFATQNGIARLSQYHEWSADGTFKVVPSSFLQLYTVNILIDQSSVPSAYFLMANKATSTYTRALDILRGHLHLGNNNPNSIMMDFEIGARNAFENVWPNVQFRMCIFHLGQSVLRYVQRNGFIAQYEGNEDFRTYVRSLVSLSFVRLQNVLPFFHILRARAPAATHQIMDYFRQTYIIRDNGNQPIFPTNNWNHYQSILDNLGRTNNAQEAFHLNLRRKFQNLHPPLSRLINVLKEEERLANQRVRGYELDPTQGLNIRPRQRQYISNDRAIRDLINRFDGLLAPNDDQVITHLRAIQYRLARNAMDNWNN